MVRFSLINGIRCAVKGGDPASLTANGFPPVCQTARAQSERHRRHGPSRKTPLTEANSEEQTAPRTRGCRHADRHPYSARGNDLYETPEVATLALLAVEQLPPTILEAACGRGAISRVLRRAGHTVIENDIVAYGPARTACRIFWTSRPPGPNEIDAVVTNPPSRLAQHFVRHALPWPRVFMLLRLTFYESERRKEVPDGRRPYGHPARVLFFRPPADDAPRRLGRKSRSNSVAYAWFVWERGYTGKPEFDRISWKRGAS